MENDLKLGILYKGGKVVNHRSLLKILVNPILRYIGFQIGTMYKDNVIGQIRLVKCARINRIKWDFKSYNDHDLIIKKRRFA